MPKIMYVNKKFNQASLFTIETANRIIADYNAQGYSLTLRQLYYQFVARGFIENAVNEYKKLGSIINDARLAGLIDWEAIEDRTRNLRKNSHWSSPEEIIETAARSFALNKRAGQECYIEVWIEKDALVGLLENVCGENDVSYFSCRGYTSQSEMWSAAMRFAQVYRTEERISSCKILHLGDHDPSGIDMSRDIEERMNMFFLHHIPSANPIELERLALNTDQVKRYNPPPNPAKSTDTRFRQYADLYGYESWELDALEPSVIVGLVHDAIKANTQQTVFNRQKRREANIKDEIQEIADNYNEVMTLFRRESDKKY